MRSSMADSEIRSSARVAPRSVSVEAATSTTISALVRAGDSTRLVRYRTVGDMSCTGAVESPARTNAVIVVEVAASTLTERGATRADDRISEAAMEDSKKEGYF